MFLKTSAFTIITPHPIAVTRSRPFLSLEEIFCQVIVFSSLLIQAFFAVPWIGGTRVVALAPTMSLSNEIKC